MDTEDDRPSGGLHTRTPLALGLRELFSQLETRLALTAPLKAYLAGGMAVHLYTGARVTRDVDAEFSGRVFLPSDLAVKVVFEDGSTQSIYFDTNYNSTFALLHERYLEDARPVDLGLGALQVHVLAPVDLAVSKIARFAANDQEDIAALVRLGLVTADEIETRATAALKGFVGGLQMLRFNIRDAVALARRSEGETNVAASAASQRSPRPSHRGG